ncbi:MAG: hypothetical protein IKF83_01430 [Clostridia bacterium]|nr:hypothetical protein [Clostridia bacterium]
MFINIKLSKLFKFFFVIVAIIMVIIFGFSAFKIYSNSNNTVSDSNIIEISPNNYTNVLKTVHEDLDSYIGKTIHFSGFVYRVFDLSDTQFVLARNMIIDADNRVVVVGFLCNYNDAKNFADTTWVDVTGTITKGNYHGDMPIIDVTDMHKTDCPTDEFVYPPDNSFVPTNSII